MSSFPKDIKKKTYFNLYRLRFTPR